MMISIQTIAVFRVVMPLNLEEGHFNIFSFFSRYFGLKVVQPWNMGKILLEIP